jgi:hypothetical protein
LPIFKGRVILRRSINFTGYIQRGQMSLKHQYDDNYYVDTGLKKVTVEQEK